MNKHFSEADLLETYYTQPGESLPVMLHLADCAECAARYERLERKIRSLAVPHAQPEAFWARQRAAIVERINGRQRARAFGRFAAAAALALIVGGTVTWPLMQQQQQTTIAQHAAETIVSEDPWDSEPLQDLQPLVEWETWVEPKNGGNS
ncbi:MAG TPA: hypothetical protein VF846_03590 [Thermoanaerobaculia bacterium]|jgi:predicted anti-sigma-YlaC factor YlaD